MISVSRWSLPSCHGIADTVHSQYGLKAAKIIVFIITRIITWICSFPRLYGALQQVPAHCLAVRLQLYCFGSLSPLSQRRFLSLQAAATLPRQLERWSWGEIVCRLPTSKVKTELWNSNLSKLDADCPWWKHREIAWNHTCMQMLEEEAGEVEGVKLQSSR